MFVVPALQAEVTGHTSLLAVKGEHYSVLYDEGNFDDTCSFVLNFLLSLSVTEL